MPLNALGSTWGRVENKLDTSSFVQKQYLRNICIESNTEDAIDIKHHFKKNLTNTVDSQDVSTKFHVVENVNQPCRGKSNVHVESMTKILLTFNLLEKTFHQLFVSILQRN